MKSRTVLSVALSIELGLALTQQVQARAPDFTFTIVNQQTSGSYHTGDLVIQSASGQSDLVSFMGTATGAYTLDVESNGSIFSQPVSHSVQFEGPGAGGGNPRGGQPHVPLGAQVPSGGDPFILGGAADGDVQVLPIAWWIGGAVVSCMVNQIAVHMNATSACGPAGVASIYVGMCGSFYSVTCNTPPPPPQPPSSGYGGWGDGGFSSFYVEVPHGWVGLYQIDQ